MSCAEFVPVLSVGCVQLLVTNLTQQARRLSDRTMFLLDGELVELDRTEVIFSDAARSQRTRDYVSGVFG